jgi:hypothetical protein
MSHVPVAPPRERILQCCDDLQFRLMKNRQEIFVIYPDRQTYCPYCPDPFSRTTKKNSITSTIKSAYVTMMGYLRLLNSPEKYPLSTASVKPERSRTINNSADSALVPVFQRLLSESVVDACGDKLRAILDLLSVGSSAIAMLSNDLPSQL